jgi:hypothetical protein
MERAFSQKMRAKSSQGFGVLKTIQHPAFNVEPPSSSLRMFSLNVEGSAISQERSHEF